MPAWRRSHSAAVSADPAPASRWAIRFSKSPLTTLSVSGDCGVLESAFALAALRRRRPMRRLAAEVGVEPRSRADRPSWHR